MRFAIPDDSDSDSPEIFQDVSDSDEESIGVKRRHAPPRSNTSRIKAYMDSSSEDEAERELNSEDEVELLGGSYESLTIGVRSSTSNKNDTRSSTYKASSSETAWRDESGASRRPSSSKRNPAVQTLRDVLTDQPSEYDAWLRLTEEDAMLDGHHAARTRCAELKEIKLDVRTRIFTAEQKRQAREEEKMTEMLQAMAIRQNREEAEVVKRFAEREKQLWADIDAAIQEVEKKEAEVKAAQALAVRRHQEAEAAHVAKEEKEAQAKKAELERRAREATEKSRAERETKAAKERAEEEEKVKAAEKSKGTAERSRAAEEWSKWVDKQKWMKVEVIEKVKGDSGVIKGLRPGMRLITRGVGQVVNTKQSIQRVTNDLHTILCEQLSSPPDPSSPTTLSSSTSSSYSYLLSHVSKTLIKQAEVEVSAKADAAFPLGRVVVGLLLRGHAALGEVLLARFVKKCPWVVPHYPTRRSDQARGEYEKSTGRPSDESLTDYISRMSGIFTLYLAILQTPYSTLIHTLPQSPTQSQIPALVPEPLRMTYAWTWVSYALRDPTDSLPPIATLLTVWVEFIGPEAKALWGMKQVGKIMELIESECRDGGAIKGDGPAARVKLGLTIEGWEQKGYVVGREWE